VEVPLAAGSEVPPVGEGEGVVDLVGVREGVVEVDGVGVVLGEDGGVGVAVGLELRVTEVDGDGTGAVAAAAVPAVAATTAASTADPAVTRIQGAQRTSSLPVMFDDAHGRPARAPARTNHAPR